MMELLVVFLIVLAIVAFVGAPLRGRSRGADPDAALRAELADLEAAKEAKYREIRDAELDQRTGKLSDEDHSLLDAELRAEAIALLKRIDAVRARMGAHAPPVALPPAVG
jgi:flagellar biosynthesis/type III secretory pathway M-ring protein FliF/YscJ